MIISNDVINIEFFNTPNLVDSHNEEIKSSINEFVRVFKITEIKLDISFCTKDEIKELNKKFRNKEAPTNVLSFPDIARIFNV